jgi:hypothetical protein
LTDHELRREHALDRAQAEGRIVQASRAHWSAAYDRDPATTEQHLAMLTPVPVGVLGRTVDQTVAAGLTLVRGGTGTYPAPAASLVVAHVHPVAAPAAGVQVEDEDVQRWTGELFAETRAGAGARKGRVTRDAQG